jgi:choline dehydrogenase-like flavoprotein
MTPELDYVIVGGGTADAVVARRLAEEPSSTVALVEAGPPDEGNGAVLGLARRVELLGGPFDFDYAATGEDGTTDPFQAQPSAGARGVQLA